MIQEGMKISKFDYRVYCKLNDTNLIRLNLSVCEKSKILLFTPMEILENLDTLNASSDYFNDICYSSKSDSGTDITLNDRIKEFIEGNKTVCQEDCIFLDYNYSISKTICLCNVEETSNECENMNINKTKLYEKFTNMDDKEKFLNLELLLCNILGSVKNIKSNIGFFIASSTFVIFILIFFVFLIKGYNSFGNQIDEIVNQKFKNEIKIKIKNDKIKNYDSKEPKVKQRKRNELKQMISKESQNSQLIKFKANNKSLRKLKENKKISNNKIPTKQSTHHNNFTRFDNPKNISVKKENFNPFTAYEMNLLSYQEALIYDKREYCGYYCSLIKLKQLFFFAFCSSDDYNSGIIKIFMPFLSFIFHYAVNALFFTESNIHKIYEDKGEYNLKYQISFILYSAIITTFIFRIIQSLVLTDKDVLEVKRRETKPLAIIRKKQNLKYIKIKHAIFFILNFINIPSFWYYLTCFNAVYTNTQLYLIKNTLISFLFSLLYPFIINIFPPLIRNCAIHSSNKNQEYLYKLSQIIQII